MAVFPMIPPLDPKSKQDLWSSPFFRQERAAPKGPPIEAVGSVLLWVAAGRGEGRVIAPIQPPGNVLAQQGV